MDTATKLFWIVAVLAAASAVQAFTPAAVVLATPVAAEAASKATTPKALSNLYNIPMKALDIVYLPLGIVETVASPLPGLTVDSGVQNMTRGLAAPVRVIQNAVMLPVNLIP